MDRGVDAQCQQEELRPIVAVNRRFSEAEFRRLWARSDLTAYAVADAVGCGPTTAIKRAKRLGLPEKSRGPKPTIDHAQLANLWRAGVSRGEIAEFFGVNGPWVSRSAKQLGLPERGRGTRPRMTLAEYRETLIAARMAETARIEQAQIKLAEMWDQPGHNTSGKRKTNLAA